VDLVIFDMDGTLCDTVDDIAGSVNAALRQLGMSPIPREAVRGYVGRGARALMEKCVGAAGARVDRALELFLDQYKVHCLDRTRVYPGVREGLARLAGLRKVILSNKPGDMCRIIMDGLGLTHHFAAIYGGESLPAKKPDPGAVREVLRLHGADPSRTLLVGDSGVDLEAARGAGVSFLAVTYGYGARDELRGADAIAGSFEEAARLIQSPLGSAVPSR
jgi:phosphoglycolate phosphatase